MILHSANCSARPVNFRAGLLPINIRRLNAKLFWKKLSWASGELAELLPLRFLTRLISTVPKLNARRCIIRILSAHWIFDWAILFAFTNREKLFRGLVALKFLSVRKMPRRINSPKLAPPAVTSSNARNQPPIIAVWIRIAPRSWKIICWISRGATPWILRVWAKLRFQNSLRRALLKMLPTCTSLKISAQICLIKKYSGWRNPPIKFCWRLSRAKKIRPRNFWRA